MKQSKDKLCLTTTCWANEHDWNFSFNKHFHPEIYGSIFCSWNAYRCHLRRFRIICNFREMWTLTPRNHFHLLFVKPNVVDTAPRRKFHSSKLTFPPVTKLRSVINPIFNIKRTAKAPYRCKHE